MTNHIVVADDTHAVQSVPMACVSAYLAAADATAGATPAGIDTIAANWPVQAWGAAVRPAGAAAFHRRAQSVSVSEGRYRGKPR
ncbi:hypothetical protein [Rhodococcus sp. H29-C3]|uniref:hypothetical protein n=1 Tax=Rhodococcus sp. H29-C3 TaxID=3046307 RepID=UPI0024BB609F|nr:hypothetical protein [Rhodococcus sp. H29-C3]MDJ0361166.1 hypothetical protein [Rhodococcus sp. H29-C3]